MKSILVGLCSTIMTTAVIGNAFYQKKQFYPSVVYITKSNPSMAVIYIQAFVFVLLMGKIMRKVFFGQLRATEMEHLIERSWYAITETCLAFTVFRDDFSPKFVALFTLLLFLKCFHWLAEDRVDYMERSPVISWLFHIRIVSLLLLLGSLDSLFVDHAYHSTLAKGASVQLVFGFEYAILWTIVINTFLKYILHTLDINSENPWENKAVYLLYSELVMGFFKVLLYLIFMVIMIKIHTFPLFAIRPMYLSIKAFKEALNDVILSRRAIRNMNTLYPDATAEELRTVDNVCIICREEMQGGAGNSKKLPCNHIFHAACLRSWFQRQQTCPTCRMDVLRSPPQQPQTGAGAQPPAAAANQAPQPANQGAQPQAPWNLPTIWPPFMPPMPAMVPPPPASTSQQAAGEPSTSQQAGGVGTQASGTAQAPPPFPFLPFFLPPPPPPPPAELRSLSEEELRRMEGQERSHLEARVQCLRNIQTLLDAATLQMFQYSSLVAHLSRIQATSSTTATTVPPAAAASTSAPTGFSPSSSTSPPNPAPDPLSSPSTSSAEVAGASLDPHEEIRRLRLQKFGSSQTSTPSASTNEAETPSPTKKTN